MATFPSGTSEKEFHVVGPFTPQELESTIELLKKDQIAFEILKDEETEKLEMRDDFANLAKKTEFRVETYLAQVFYLKIPESAFAKMKQVFADLGMATGQPHAAEELDNRVEPEVYRKSAQQKTLQKSLVFIYVFYFIVALIVGVLGYVSFKLF